jgi:hypothetical protein
MTKKEKMDEISIMIANSPSFKSRFNTQISLIQKVLPFIDQQLVDRIYAFLLLESKSTK